MTEKHTTQSIDALTLKAILRSAAAGIVTIDGHGIIHALNPATERLFGYAESEMIGRNISAFMPEPYASAHDDYIRQYLRTGRSRIIGVGREVVGRRKDGATFPMHLSVGEFESEGVRYFTGVLIDLTALKSAEERARHQQALFQSIFEGLPDPVVIGDMSRTLQLYNPAFTRVFGYEADEIAGRSSLVIYASSADWERHGRLGYGVDGEREHKTHVLKFRRKDGQTFPGATVRTIIKDRSGHELGYLAVIRDISDDLRREAILMQAQRLEAIGQLTGGVAHDFNNILTVILGNLELLEGRLRGELEQALAREAQEAAEMGARLTDRLLTFARRQHLETRKINLNEFVLGMTDILRRTIGEDVDISTALAADLWPTEVDPGQVESAVLNLAINARDAMPTGGRIIIETRNVTFDREAVSALPELKAGDYVVLSVSDTGHGMAPDVKNRAFEPFFTTKGPGKGSGLGLATIYGFAKQSGGHATIYSEVGAGTTVNLYLPRTQADAQVAGGRNGPAQASGAGERVLVVEDDESVRRLTVTRLKDLCYHVVEARNGIEALETLADGIPVDLVFSDLVMPGGLSGLDLCREVKARFPGVRLLLTSGYSEEMLRANGTGDTSGVRLLRKPYRQADLALALREALRDA